MRILTETLSQMEREFQLGYAQSSEIGLIHGEDISDGGIGVLVFDVPGYRGALVVADSNNAVSGLRERISSELETMRIHLIELCTSDTHNLAARGLVERGYFALGESTAPETIVGMIRTLAVQATNRATPSTFAIQTLQREVPLIGHESLDDFAKMTEDATKFAKGFMKAVLPIMIALGTAMLFY